MSMMTDLSEAPRTVPARRTRRPARLDHGRTQTAVTALQQWWADAALLISGTTDDLEVGLRARVLPANVQARVAQRRHARLDVVCRAKGTLVNTP